MSTPSPQDVQALIDSAIAEFERVTGKYNPNGKHWKLGLAYLASARAEAGQLVAPTPTPPPPSTSQLLGIYLDPEGQGSINYSTEMDAAKAAIPALNFAMAPLDSSVINHIGTKVQWCLIPAGMQAAQFIQYGVPCWQTGLVDGFVVVDEPGSDSTSEALIKTICAYVKANCVGTNDLGQTVKTAVTQFGAATLTALANEKDVDILIHDCYPQRSGEAAWESANAACEAAVTAGLIEEFWTVLDAFEAPNYPAPTEAELLAQIAKAQASKAARLVIYAWGQAGGTPLPQLPGLVTALNTI